MLRTFETHRIRKQQELSGRMWRFIPQEGERRGEELKVMVPSCWETYPGFENYRGTAYYETEFSTSGNIRIEFKGISHFGEVFVDGQKAGEHYGSYTPFAVYAGGLKPGMHTLRVLVDNAFREEYALDFPNDYMSYGGISRGVVLEEVPEIYVEWIHITPLKKEEGIWHVKTEVFCRNEGNSTANADLKVRVAGQEYTAGDLAIPVGGHIVYSEIIRAEQVEDWNMESPVMYEAAAVLSQSGQEIDDLSDRFGFRSVEVAADRILLNGKPVRIKGFCRHEDHPQYGCALPAEAMAYDLQQMIDMNANSVRTSHYPNDELFLDMCDELGILVWEENHARGIEVKRMENPNFEPQCEQVIQEMITRHYNHPSIYIWGILNECGSETEYGRICYDAQYRLIRSLDTSRPCSSASCKYDADICQDLPDVCAWNMYPYWYDNDTATEKLNHLYGWLQEEGRGHGKPFMVTEVGAGAIYGFRSVNQDKWSEEEQAEILKKQLQEIAAFESCMGIYIWQFCDVRVSREWAMNRPRTRNNKGIVDEYRRRKLSHETVKKIFGSMNNYW